MKVIIIDLISYEVVVILIYINLSIFSKEKKAQLQSNTLEPYQVTKQTKEKRIEKDLKIETLIKEVEDDKIDLMEYVSEVSKLFHFIISKKKANKIIIL